MQISRSDALDDAHQLITLMSSKYRVKPKVQSKMPISDLMRAVQDIATHDSSLGRGEFVSRILRLPDAWRNSCLEYINAAGAYQHGDGRFHLTTRIRNSGNSVVKIVASVKVEPQRDMSGEVQDAWVDIPQWHAIDPGEEIELPTNRAINALWKYGRFTQDPARWDSDMSTRKSRGLEEIAFHAEFQGLDGAGYIRVDSDGWQSDRAGEAMTAAAALESDDPAGALGFLTEIPEHYAKPDDFDSMLTDLHNKVEAAKAAKTKRPRGRPRKDE
jgi:hypothetical protein